MAYTLYNADCLDIMRGLADASIDALITDPPYATTNLKWDKPIDWQAFWQEAHRVCKPTAPMVLFSAQPFTTDLIMSNRKAWRYELIWDKVSSVGFFDAKNRPLRAHEHVQVFVRAFSDSTYNPQMRTGKLRKKGGGERKGDFIYNTKTLTTSFNDQYYPTSVLTFSNSSHANVLHPTQKPLDLMTWLVRTYSNSGDTVLDPFMGSGTTIVACEQEGRVSIGIEKDTEHGYFAAAQKRIEAIQPRLEGMVA